MKIPLRLKYLIHFLEKFLTKVSTEIEKENSMEIDEVSANTH